MGNRNQESKMASHSQQNKLSSVEQKKQELLRRIETKKSGNLSASSTNTYLPTASFTNTNNVSNPSVKPTLFNNDGNFLARFQAMQQQSSSSNLHTAEPNKSVQSNEDSSKKRKVTVSMKVVKTPSTKTTIKPKSKLSRFDVFETPEDENGNCSILYEIFSHMRGLSVQLEADYH